jgi:hypothetical protein
MTSFASSPGTDVDPMWSTPARPPGRRPSAARQAGSLARPVGVRGHQDGRAAAAGHRGLLMFREKGSSRSSHSRSTSASSSSRVPELGRTTSAAASRSWRDAWAAIRERASASVIPRCPVMRCSRTSSGASTTSNEVEVPLLPGFHQERDVLHHHRVTRRGRDHRRGASAHQRMDDAVELRTPFRLLNTMAPRRGRSSRPSPSRISGPNASTTAARPGVPGSTTSRAIASASTSTAPSSARRVATRDFPEAMPPVNPIFSTPQD